MRRSGDMRHATGRLRCSPGLGHRTVALGRPRPGVLVRGRSTREGAVDRCSTGCASTSSSVRGCAFSTGPRWRASRTSRPRARRSSPATTCRSPTRSSCRWCAGGRSPSWPRATTSTRPVSRACSRSCSCRRWARSRSTAPVGGPPRRRSAPGSGCSVRATFSASTPRAPAPATVASTAARPVWPAWRSRPASR